MDISVPGNGGTKALGGQITADKKPAAPEDTMSR